MKQDAQIKRKVSALDMLNSTRHAFKRKTDSDNGTSDDDDEESGETEEDEPPLEVSDYGLEVAFEQVRCGVHTCCKTRACFEVLCVLLIALHLIVQLKKIYTTLSLEEPEEDSDEEKEGNYTRRKVELGVLLNAGGDFLKALGVDEQGRALGKAEKAKAKVKKGAYSDTDSDSDESNASQQSSRSYLQGVDKYRTSKRLCCAVLWRVGRPILMVVLIVSGKQLQNAIVRRRNKLKDLQEVGKQVRFAAIHSVSHHCR
jgi:hypothetical protein